MALSVGDQMYGTNPLHWLVAILLRYVSARNFPDCEWELSVLSRLFVGFFVFSQGWRVV